MIEVRVKKGYLHWITRLMEPGWHAFHSEPWHPDGWIVRGKMYGAHIKLLEQYSFAWDSWEKWDASGDIELLGVDGFKSLSSVAILKQSVYRNPFLAAKFIHCYLNSWGYSRKAELRFYKRMMRATRVMVWLTPFIGEDRAAQVARKLVNFPRLNPDIYA